MFGVKKYTHTQSSPASTWTVNHNLGVMPVAGVFTYVDGVLTPVFPASLTHSNDNNTLTVTWSSNRTGEVHLAYDD